jgi:aspartate carbamoyltransferase catalytic subunit
MAISKEFKTLQLKDYIERTELKGKNLNFLTDLSKEQLYNLFKAAEMIEPFHKSKINLLEGKQLCTMFFQPSTRTRFSTETAMQRLGGTIISESNPAANSSAAKDESLSDTLRVISEYADIIALRHYNDTTIFDDLKAAQVPVISCGYGNITHPTQGLLDMYTAYRALGDLEGVKVMVTSPDLTRARSGQSFAMGLARLGAEIIYSGPSELRTPETIRQKLDETGCKYTEYFDLSQKDQEDLIMECSLVYLPGCSVPKGQDAREVFMKSAKNYYIELDTLIKAKEKYGRTIGIMHSLPRFQGEFDFEIDKTEHELYFKQIGFSIPIRMALIASMIGLS